ncbi:ComEA family DNA-binding protein [Desulfosudis oleivorans]|uniref:Competence protein ComEA helix-hairpin-helix repeat protein n=1 Tax=Desulfosudis oleivorans (strain DSM 6200 / JCM 39069 / Hxd3) TaxID=96561 RepID=A8ZWL0_DESOH|nr:ComEA family DNA-binding protein [Desulfosudis oleivorans]ABW66818.1 competence protein ComEA helix-hairpin-helix repeat protein [Desulfosudis oleivorans Hxd3]
MRRQKLTVLVMSVIAIAMLVMSGTALAEEANKGMQGGKDVVAKAAGQLVNINTASVDELTALTGVGKEIAQRIIEYREANGAFKSVEQLQNVKGIGAKILEKNRSRITVGEVAK